MADKYYRLISVLINICPEPIRELFLQRAKADTKPGVPFTTLDAYLANKKPTLLSLKSRRKLRDDQFDLLFPSLRSADESQWDITLLVVLISELFASSIPNHIQISIKDIRDVRNNLQHIPKTANVSNSTFKQAWNRLEIATLDLARHVLGSNYEDTMKERIRKALVSNMPDLSNTLRFWYDERITQMEHEIGKMGGKINEISEDARKCKTEAMKSTAILENSSIVKPGPSGKDNKRLKTVDNILKKMQDEFERTMNSERQGDFTAPTEVDKIKLKLSENSFVLVAGQNKSFYLPAALLAVQEMKYQEKRSVQMNTSSDWRHVDREDVDFVLCCDPFGRDAFEEEKSKGMADIFSSIQYTVNEEIDGKKLAVMIVTNIAVLNDCKEKHSHEILEEVVTVYDTTSESHPIDLTVARRTSKYIQSMTQNLKEQTRFFLQYHAIASKQVESGILSNAKVKFTAHKAVVLVGPKGSGKTSLAVALAASYQPSHVLLLTYPEQVQHVDVKSTSLVLIVVFAGEYTFNKNQIENWYITFNQLNIMKTVGNINVVITCEEEKLQKCCKEIATHPLLEHTVELAGKRVELKQEMVNADKATHETQSVSNDTVISLDEPSASQQGGSHLNVRVLKYSPIPRVKQCMDLKVLMGDFYIICTSMCLTKDNNICIAFNLPDLSTSLFSKRYLVYQDTVKNRIQKHPVKDQIDQMCCTKTGVVAVMNGGFYYHSSVTFYRITKSVLETSAAYNIETNRICKAVSCDDNDQIYMLFSNGKVMLYEIQGMRLIVEQDYTVHVPELIAASDTWIIHHKGHICINTDTRLYYRNFRTNRIVECDHQLSFSSGICTSSEDPYTVFLAHANRILQYNTNLEIISNISLPDYMRVEQMMFDKAQSRLICYKRNDKIMHEVYLR